MQGSKVLWLTAILVGGVALAGVWFATQWTAAALEYQAGLGPPWFLLAGRPIYPPPAFFWWWFVYDAYAPTIFLRGAAIAASGGVLCVVLAMALSVWRAREHHGASTFGTARWASDKEIRAAGLLGETGVFLGRYGDRYLRHDGPEHILGFAPTRMGKGVGWVIPSLSRHQGRELDADGGLSRNPGAGSAFRPDQPWLQRLQPLAGSAPWRDRGARCAEHRRHPGRPGR